MASQLGAHYTLIPNEVSATFIARSWPTPLTKGGSHRPLAHARGGRWRMRPRCCAGSRGPLFSKSLRARSECAAVTAVNCSSSEAKNKCCKILGSRTAQHHASAAKAKIPKGVSNMEVSMSMHEVAHIVVAQETTNDR